MTVLDQMKQVLRDSGLFTEEQIASLMEYSVSDAIRQASYDDDERPWSDDDDQEEDNDMEDKPLKKFRVLHPIGGALNTFCERGKYEYETVFTVHAHDIGRVFVLCQNDLSQLYVEAGLRSTSVGDIIVDDSADAQEYPLGKHYFIKGMGFEEIPATMSQYIDWTNHVRDIDETDKLMFSS